MLSIKPLMIMCVVMMAAPLMASPLTASDRERLEVQRCGRELTNVLQVICNGKFQSRNGKRSGATGNLQTDYFIDGQSSSIENEIEATDYGYGTGLRYRRSTSEHGIVERCCEKACSIASMMIYCEKE